MGPLFFVLISSLRNLRKERDMLIVNISPGPGHKVLVEVTSDGRGNVALSVTRKGKQIHSGVFTLLKLLKEGEGWRGETKLSLEPGVYKFHFWAGEGEVIKKYEVKKI